MKLREASPEVFLLALLSGLVVFAVLVGFVNESVMTMIQNMNTGHSIVAESGHVPGFAGVGRSSLMQRMAAVAWPKRAAEVCLSNLVEVLLQ